MGSDPTATGELDRVVVGRARSAAVALAAVVLVPTAVSEATSFHSATRSPYAVAALLGIISPLIGFRLYHWLRERVAPRADHPSRCAAFLRATIISLSTTAAIALFGVVAYGLSREVQALIGVVTHLIVVGALWPTPEKLEGFLLADEVDTPEADR